MGNSSNLENIIRFLKRKNIWYNLSENYRGTKVISCNEAAMHRKRLGHIGIPIFDELKSELGYFTDKNNKKQRVLVHCRGNQKLDRLKISSILNAEYNRLSSNNVKKGLINPFDAKYRNLLQIFDISTTKKFHPPYTMMTNAGDFSFAIEFEVNSLIKSLKQVIVDDIIRTNNYKGFIKHKIGILTGNGPHSGMLLWKKINKKISLEFSSRLKHSFRGALSYPEILIESLPDLGVSMELDKRLQFLEDTIIRSVIKLCESGVSIIAIACNVSQFFENKINEVCALYNVEFVSMPYVVDKYLQNENINDLFYFGINHVLDFEKFSAYKTINNKYKLTIPSKTSRKKIEKIILTAQKDIDKAANLLKDFRNGINNDNILIVLTEISTIIDKHRKLFKNKVIVDSITLLANEIGELYVNGIFETLYIDKEKDMILYEFLNSKSKLKAKNEIWNIMCEIDYEFIPPLSYRDSTTFKFTSKTIEENKPTTYFNELMKQEIIVSKKKENGYITGFFSYIPNYQINHKQASLVCHYVTTIGITKGERGNGITKRFYKLLEEKIRKTKSVTTIATRTWTTNKSHIRILLDLGYKQIILEKNDRGQGVHTIYFAKEIISSNDLDYNK